MIRTTQKSILGVILLSIIIVFTPYIGRAVEPCPLPSDNNALLDLLWPMFDSNGDNGLSMAELSLIYPVPQQYFDMFDSNRDGKVDRQEFQPILTLLQLYLPGGVLSLVDANGNQLIELQEVSGYVNQQQFQMLDRNKNGVIDCGDIGPIPPLEGEPEEGEPSEEGEVITEGEIVIEGEVPTPETNPCGWVQMAISEFSNLDQNGDGVITRDELNFPIILIYPPIVDFDELFNAFDLDGNGAVTLQELEAWLDICGNGTGGNGECPLPAISLQTVVELVFPFVDTNADGKLSPNEIRSIYPDIDNLLGQYNFTLEGVFVLVDTNRDGGVSPDELMVILNLLAPQLGIDPNNVLSIIDKNGDSMISYEEVSEYVTQEQFAYVDFNGNGLIDCNDLEMINLPPLWEGELPPWEGEIPIPDIDPCLIGPIALQNFDFLDQNKDGKIIKDELITPLTVVYPIPIDPASLDAIWGKFDLDSDGGITRDEINAVIADCPELPPIEGEPIPIEGEFEIPTDPCIIGPVALEYFDLLDKNGDGSITLDELQGPVIMSVLPLPIDMSIITEVFQKFDLNADGAVTREEIKAVLDNCDVVPTEGELPPIEGEIIILPDLWNPCSLAPYAVQMFSTIDQNRDGVIDINEIISAIASVYMMPIDMTWLSRIVSLLDLDDNGVITMEELQSINQRCQAQSNETGGEGPGGNEPPTTLVLERAVSGRIYTPGQTLTVILTVRNPSRLNVSALGLRETLPTGWVLQSVVESSNAVVTPSEGATGTLEFAWLDIPPFPVKVVYTVSIPADADGQVAISGYVLYRTVDSEELTSPVVETVLIKGWSPDRAHSADSNRDWSISLTEMLRVIQMFNLGGYGCDDTSEDGYAPGEGKNRTCRPHSGDYQIQDWKFNLSELLRQIQLYNAPGKGYVLQEGTEDGFAPLLN